MTKIARIFLLLTLISSLYGKIDKKDDTDVSKRYGIFYLQAEGFALLSHNHVDGIPLIGVGYRCHKEFHGFDLSLSGVPTSVCGKHGFIPVLKASYLNYPLYKKNNFFYAGIGAVGIAARFWWPMITLGREFALNQRCKFFIQLDATYPAIGLGAGIGF